MNVFVMLFRDESGNEGIHTLSVGDQNIVLMFEDEDDATRYALLLEAQDFMTPTVESIDRQEIEDFCEGAHYQSKLVPKGFVPESDSDRLLIVPPASNMEQTGWEKDDNQASEGDSSDKRSNHPAQSRDEIGDDAEEANASSAARSDGESFPAGDLDDIRRRLEGLL